jgi:hypothetical protein
MSACNTPDARLTPLISITRTHVEVTLSTGYVGSSFVYRSSDGTLAGASTFQDFGGYDSELLPQLDDAGVSGDADLPASPDSDFTPFVTYAGVEVSSSVIRCRMCGDATGLDASFCDRTIWSPRVPIPRGR